MSSVTAQRAMEGDYSRIKAIVRKEASKERNAVEGAFQEYMDMYDEKKGASVEQRKAAHTTIANHFYDLVTDFYEWGWGHSFHFAPRHRWESFESSIARHEMYLAHKLQLKPGMRVLDVGCGVGGPLRTIARFSKAHVVGLNNNEYQIERAKRLCEQAGLSHLTSFLKADFMHVPQEDNTYDAIYQIEATCHAPDKVGIYSEIYRLLKPGGIFAGYEWVITDKYDPNNPKHVAIKRGLEVGNGLPEIESYSVLRGALEKAGFVVEEACDQALTADIPWYNALGARFSLTGLFHTWAGRQITGALVYSLEKVGIAPKGSNAVHNMLLEAAQDLVDSGVEGLFTPMYLVVCRKK